MGKVKIEYYESGCLKSFELSCWFMSGKAKITSDDTKKPKAEIN